MQNPIDKFLNNVTMYRLMMCGLCVEAILAILFAAFGWIAYSPVQMIVSLVVLIACAEGSNRLFARAFAAVRNTESAIITALLLFFIMDPASASLPSFYILPLASMIAMLSKYVFAIHRRHFFNPVAITAVIFDLVGIGAALWWIATPMLFPFALVFGLLVVRKTRRFHMVLPFFIVAILVAFVRGEQLTTFILSWPLVFFGTMMLTEPRTAPSRKRDQILYGTIVGVLFASPFTILPATLALFLTPELTLVTANLLAYLVSSKQVLKLKYKATEKCTEQVCDFAFTPDQPLKFQPGQFLEWTLPVDKPDERGNRRFFTVASSPTDADVHLGVRIDHEHGSAFKKALSQLKEGDEIFASHAAGEFVLPSDQEQKLVFVAGGIGVTPFRSMARWLKETGQTRDIILFYAANTEKDFAYQAELEAMAPAIGMKVVCIVGKPSPAWKGMSGYLTKELIDTNVPDSMARMYYLSGPNAMVENYRRLLRSMNIKSSMIMTDYFPGF